VISCNQDNQKIIRNPLFQGDIMKKNVGSLDRNIRIAVGSVLLLIGLFAQIGGGLRIGAILVAVVAFATAFLNF
jgi:hypothetical protein